MAKTNKKIDLEDMNIEEAKNGCLKFIKNGDFHSANRYFKQYIELVVFNLLLSDQFFGYFIIHMQREISYDFSAPAGVTIKKGFPLLLLNPILLLRYTNKEIKGILKHEVYHLLHFHILRSKENNNRFDSFIENIAMDLAINQKIPEIPDECVTFDRFCREYGFDPFKVRRNDTFEYYQNLIHSSSKYKEESEKYKQFMKDLSDVMDKLKNKMNQSGGLSNGQGNKSNGKSIDEMINEILNEKYPIDHSMWKDSDNSDVQNMKEIVKQMVNEAAKACGNIPGDLQELINKINEPTVIRWQDILKTFVGSVRVPFKDTMLRRPRRAPERYDLKGRISDRKVKIAVAIDTSGSMGERELQFVFTEIFSILKLVNFELTIIECDMEVQRVYKAKTINEIDMKVKGRGK